MKYLLIVTAFLFAAFCLHGQKYPEPEFSNEIYYLKKDSVHSLVRLEKSSAKMDTKTKAGGFGGMENGYFFDGEKSDVRIKNGANLSFVFSTGASGSARSSSSPNQDSMMRANGVDPSMMSSMTDPSRTVSLYKTDVGKGSRKILLQKVGGAFGSKKNQSSDKYTFSIKKIRDGYWELVIDKTLPKGEYAFNMMNMTTGNMDGSTMIFAFAVD
jgi:hypothetical protein